MNNIIYVKDETELLKAHELANFTQILQVKTVIDEPITGLYLSIDKLGLAINGYPNFSISKPVYIEEIYKNLMKRVKSKESLKQELLIKAIKESSVSQITIFDLTAGLGLDALIMLNYGYEVTLVESNPILATILYYAQQEKIFSNNTYIYFSDSRKLLQNNLNVLPEIIYLDPMFNLAKGGAAKKNMQLIQQLTSGFMDDYQSENNEEELLKLSLSKAKLKVVVKRHIKQLPITHSFKPNYSKFGSKIRYDVYLTNNSSL